MTWLKTSMPTFSASLFDTMARSKSAIWWPVSPSTPIACKDWSSLPATAGLLYLGASRALDGRMTVGTILVFLAYLASLYEPINTIVYTASTLQTLSANTARVLEVLDYAPDVRECPGAVPI